MRVFVRSFKIFAVVTLIYFLPQYPGESFREIIVCMVENCTQNKTLIMFQLFGHIIIGQRSSRPSRVQASLLGNGKHQIYLESIRDML
jgi:hypothetical protein